MTQSPVKAETLRAFAAEAFLKAGVSEENSGRLAEILVEADLRGVDTHGMMLLQLYVQRIRQGHITAKPQIGVVTEGPGYALVEGDRGMGHLVASRSMGICSEKARASGIAMVGARNSCHFGAAAYYAMLALKEDLIGFCTTNSPPLIAPVGGVTPTFGNNPFAFAIPAGKEKPIVLDMALSVAAMAKIYRAYQMGQKIPPEWGLDKQGRPTDDPKVAYESGLQPAIGGHKGYGLAVVMNVLAAVLTGSLSATEVLNFFPAFGIGHFFLAIDPRVFMPLPEFKERIDKMIGMARSTALAEGVDRVYLPGEPEHLQREKRLREGVPISDDTRRRLEAVRKDLGVSVSLD